jgi:hypothetical protein
MIWHDGMGTVNISDDLSTSVTRPAGHAASTPNSRATSPVGVYLRSWLSTAKDFVDVHPILSPCKLGRLCILLVTVTIVDYLLASTQRWCLFGSHGLDDPSLVGMRLRKCRLR